MKLRVSGGIVHRPATHSFGDVRLYLSRPYRRAPQRRRRMATQVEAITCNTIFSLSMTSVRNGHGSRADRLLLAKVSHPQAADATAEPQHEGDDGDVKLSRRSSPRPPP